MNVLTGTTGNPTITETILQVVIGKLKENDGAVFGCVRSIIKLLKNNSFPGVQKMHAGVSLLVPKSTIKYKIMFVLKD